MYALLYDGYTCMYEIRKKKNEEMKKLINGVVKRTYIVV